MKKKPYKTFYMFIFCFLAISCNVDAAPVILNSSNLPIIIIDTNGKAIPDEPKITANMKIVYNTNGTRNDIKGPFEGYDGEIGIEIRGGLTQMYPKKQYAVETRNKSGEKWNVPLLGMPEENDWIFYAPFSDKTLIRNALAYKLSNDMGRYASKTKFFELILNGEYQGVYVLMEKVKRDKARVDISKIGPNDIDGDNLTGGYIVKIDKLKGRKTEGWHSEFSSNGEKIYYQYHYPDQEDITKEQKKYIQRFISQFENLMEQEDYDSPSDGYNKILDTDSFIDFLILNEIGKNVDGYRLSTFMYKDKDSKDGRLKMGPIWDFNYAFGNAAYYESDKISGWVYDFSCKACVKDENQVPFWWGRLFESFYFQSRLRARWIELRDGILSEEYIFSYIDETASMLDEAQARNFAKWPILGEYVPYKPPKGWEERKTYDSELDYLKKWIGGRLEALDMSILGTNGN